MEIHDQDKIDVKCLCVVGKQQVHCGILKSHSAHTVKHASLSDECASISDLTAAHQSTVQRTTMYTHNYPERRRSVSVDEYLFAHKSNNSSSSASHVTATRRRPTQRRANRAHLSEIIVCILLTLDALQILLLDQYVDAFLDNGNFGFEASGQLVEYFHQQLLVLE